VRQSTARLATTRLDAFQDIIANALTVLAVVHIPILIVIAWALGRDIVTTLSIAAVLAAAPVVARLLHRPVTIIGFALSVALVGQTSVLVYLLSGHPWQVEMHFYYFAVLAMLAGFCEWRVLLATAALIAAQHLGLNWALPAAIYPGGSNFLRVLVHATVVVVETVMLLGIGLTIRSAFAQADEARFEAERAAAEIARVGDAQKQELALTTVRAERMRDLLDRFQREILDSTGILSSAAAGLLTDADGLGRAAAHVSAQSITATVASESTAKQVRSAAHAGEELARTISDVGSNAAQSSQLAAEAVDEAIKTSATIDELATVANEIGKVTGLISAIASQTNLLALNATIEAARAGEAGRGFAIVAQEVKALAGQTAAATQDIGRRIGAMQDATGRSVEAIAAISGTIRELDEFSARIAVAVEQQAAAAHEIAGSANAAAGNVVQVNGAIVEIEKVVEETARSAGKLGTAAADVTEQAKRIRNQVGVLSENIRAIHA
jgi:methyl-accepting chemotaxis protein